MKKIILSLLIGGLTYAQAPAGYYNSANGLSGAALKTALSNIITNGHQDKGYSGLWTGYKTTDIDKNYENDGSILDIYSENPSGTDPYKYTPGTNQCGTYSVEGNCYNREHIVPQSLFNEAAPMVSDIHFIRATDGKVNGMRSNYPFGKVGTATFTSKNGSKLGNSVSSGYSGTVFEPIDAFKGDVARMIFYFVTRYQSKLSTFTTGNMLGNSTFPGLQTWELNVLLAWHNQDPVSQAEINRNNASYTFQGNRNPFIDNPNYVNLIWGSGSGSGTTDPGTTNPPTNCGNETFETIPSASSSSYLTRTWTNGGVTWTATDARTDQTISTKAITVRDGSLQSNTLSNGISSLTVTTQLKFTGSNGTLNLQVNGTTVGTIPYSATAATTTINNINVSGNVVISLVNTVSGNRVAIDNVSWTCYSSTAKQSNTAVATSSEAAVKETEGLQISPNPISDQEIFVKGNTENIKKAEIYNLQGKVMQTIDNPFKNSRNSIKIKNLEQGVYLLKLDQSTLKFIVK
ncbi:endonuclease [Chryseobacterium daecheongense]|uniref:Secreted protein (Por secretion system target) n=1 Tax=Chryseobacterium daecheongense TaxID=192389 RepID=A0A3N0W5X6_9FLAO|nr:endonuclease [Chryseobacterium daecheongense]ROI00423.1 T9SS C-terminal target domain-containing protein [Chryseobacterium daecheongense]TDX94609.1 putative secreted protein (Por secretion system target) [Chryseobacterium daecheongense]